MSNQVNTNLLELAVEAIDSSGSESYIQTVEQALDDNDLEQLAYILNAYCAGCGELMTANCNNANCGGF